MKHSNRDPIPLTLILSPLGRGKGEGCFQIKGEKGFTLVELILAIVIVGIIAIAITMAFVPTMNVSVSVDTRKEALQGGRLAMERILREIREARSINGGFTATSLTFVNAANSTITYSWSGTPSASLRRNGSDLTCCVEAMTLTYLKKDGTTTTNPSEVWRIQTDLQIKVGDETVELRSEVNPRNIY